ncbi:MAG: nuclease A inhibitor family protein [Spirosomataceae bacterium]
MENNQSENLPNPNQIDSGIKTNRLSEVTDLLKDLWYPSESDEPIEWVSFLGTVSPPLTVSDLEFGLGVSPSTVAEEISAEEFWSPVTTMEEWYGEDEKAQVEKFLEVKAVLETDFKKWQAFRVGQTEVDLYLLTQLNEKEWGGLKTMVVET